MKAEKGDVLLLDSIKGSAEMTEVTFKADDKLRVILYAGKRLNEPIVARGPFVMNTEEEITQAYSDYNAGRF